MVSRYFKILWEILGFWGVFLVELEILGGFCGKLYFKEFGRNFAEFCEKVVIFLFNLRFLSNYFDEKVDFWPTFGTEF